MGISGVIQADSEIIMIPSCDPISLFVYPRLTTFFRSGNTISCKGHTFTIDEKYILFFKISIKLVI